MAGIGNVTAADGSTQDLVDIYDDNLNHNNGEDEMNDLYDDVLTGSVSRVGILPQKAVPSEIVNRTVKDEIGERPRLNTRSWAQTKRLSVYVGNFSWWTSDTDLTNIAQTLGVKDVVEIKFAENRANGQSRGYAEVVVATEESLQKLLEALPYCMVNGEKVDCRFATRQNLALFEDIANKRVPQRANSKDSTDSTDNHPTAPPVEPNSFPHIPPPNHLPNRPPPPSVPFFSRPPPLFPHLPRHIPPPSMPHLFPPPLLHLPSQPPPSLHLNPAFFPPPHDSYSTTSTYNRQNRDSEAPAPQVPDGEFEELMNRNRAIASSAITKAVSGATAGDLRVAMETLLTAIAVIKQSRVFADERCQTLVTSLKDCLVSIQANFGTRKRHRSRERDRDRDRERERDRERDRDREREDSYSQGWESYGMSRRHRERSLSGERERERVRDRERDRERDRHREHRERHR